MKYGFMNLCFDHDIRSGRTSHNEIPRWGSEKGFDGVEIYLPTLPGLSWNEIDQAGKLLKEYSISMRRSKIKGFFQEILFLGG